MIVSHHHRFVFVKGRKVAGTSIEIALSSICGPDDIIVPITPIDERTRIGTGGGARNYSEDREAERAFLERVAAATPAALAALRPPRRLLNSHASLAEAERQVPEVRDYTLIFAERSPYAKAVSLATWRDASDAYKAGGSIDAPLDMVARLVRRAIADDTIGNCRNIDHYRGVDGTIRAPGWRHETLAADFAAFVGSLGCAPPALPTAKSASFVSHEAALAALRPRQIDHINRVFAAEFDAFGYPMADPGARHDRR